MWGTATVLYALATVVQAPIDIDVAEMNPTLEGPRPMNVLVIKPFAGNPKEWREPIRLFHDSRVHFDRMIEGAGAPPGTHKDSPTTHASRMFKTPWCSHMS